MKKQIDIVLINPGDRKQVFQELGDQYSAIEPPFWIAVIAAYLRNKGFSVAIIDSNAENIAPAETAERVNQIDPLLAAVIVYGSQPSASTQNMTIANSICASLRQISSAKIAIGGLHPSALPGRTLQESSADFVIQGEGPYTLASLLTALKSGGGDKKMIPGLWYFDNNSIVGNKRAPLISDLDEAMPVAAWDLLPMDKYRAHNWHCFDDINNRSPYGAIYTSLGCPYSCVFCCINAPFGKPGIRYRSPEIVTREIKHLASSYGIRNMKIVDELFVLHDSHYMSIVDRLIDMSLGLNIWAYARVDTIKPRNLDRMKRAGINWLALGIESANPDVRDGAQKRIDGKEIKNVVGAIQDSGIRVIGNYIFGLPEDNVDTMQETLDMAVDLNCEFANFYCAMAYPGSRLYDIAIENGWKLPDHWHGFSQHSFDMLPLPTKHISAADVLRFRDNAFHTYFENPAYLAMLQKKFGGNVEHHIVQMTKTRLKRNLLLAQTSANSV